MASKPFRGARATKFPAGKTFLVEVFHRSGAGDRADCMRARARDLPARLRRLEAPRGDETFLRGSVTVRAQGPRWLGIDIQPMARGQILPVRRAGGEWLLFACAVRRRRSPVGASPTRRTLQPEATGAVMEVTKWLKPLE